MKIDFANISPGQEYIHLITMDEKLHHSFFIKHLEKEYKTQFLPLLKQLNFTGKKGQGQLLTIGNDIFAFYGIGKKEELNQDNILSIGGACYSWLKNNRIGKAAIHVGSLDIIKLLIKMKIKIY